MNAEETERKAPLTRREIVSLILATYRSSFPYLVIFLVGLLVATWLFTEVVFR